MLKKICTVLLACVMFVCLFTGCQVEVATPSTPSLNDILGETEADTTATTNNVTGTWVVGGVTYNNKLYDISQKEELASIYSATMLEMNEDGTFSFTNFLTFTGNYYWQDETTILLYADTVYNIDETVVEDMENCVFIATVLDETTLLWNDYDPIMGKTQHEYSEDPYYLERYGIESKYISENCTPLQ